MTKSVSQNFGKVIQIDETQIHQHFNDLVRGSVEEALNKLLDAEADQLCNAARYERTEARKDTRAGHYQRLSIVSQPHLHPNRWAQTKSTA